jgi:hypothetical protein
VLTAAMAEMSMEYNIPDETRSIIPGTKDYVSVMGTRQKYTGIVKCEKMLKLKGAES